MLTLLRHAETDFNRDPKRFQGRRETSISASGAADAKRFGQRSAKYDGVVCSPALRCRQTVQALGLPEVVRRHEPRLVEIDVGRWEGCLHADVAETDGAAYRAWISSPEWCCPGGGESLQDMRCRVLAAIRELQSEFTGCRGLVVTHGGPIRIVRIEIERRSLNEFHQLQVPNLGCVDLPDACTLGTLGEVPR